MEAPKFEFKKNKKLLLFLFRFKKIFLKRMNSHFFQYFIIYVAYTFKFVAMNHDSRCECLSSICVFTTTGEACGCANPFLARYSTRTSFPTTCTTNNDVV
jgi:hypothetical protein